MYHKYVKPVIIVITLFLWVGSALAEVPVRVSVKFILSGGGSRAATGNLNTNSELDDQISFGNALLSRITSELRVKVIEVVDVQGIDKYYTGLDIVALRVDAMNNQALYAWRNDAINIYINGGSGSGLAYLPSYNNIIMIGQNCRATTVMHEIGHSMALTHTHDSDSCSDTLTDDAFWNQNAIATNNFGSTYNSLTQGQKDDVDNVWFNVMSYHPTRNRITPCQMNRESVQGYLDRAWMYSKTPVYVDSGYPYYGIGSFTSPYRSFQSALDSSTAGNVIVLEGGRHSMTQTQINLNVELVTRGGQSTITRPDNSLYTLPTELEHSKNPEVCTHIIAAALDDRLAVRAVAEGKKAAVLAYDKSAMARVKADYEASRKKYFNAAVSRLVKAGNAASGKENIAVLLELAQRYRHAGKPKLAIKYYKLVASRTKQKYLKKEALHLAAKCR